MTTARPNRLLPAAVAAVAALVSAGVLSGVLLFAQPPLPAPPTPQQVDVAQGPVQPPPNTGIRRFGLAAPLPRTKTSVRLATYNLENLFDDHDDPALSGEYNDARILKPDDDCKQVAAAIKAIDADVIAVQEIESLEALTWFRDKYLKGLGYDHVVSVDAGDERGIEQGVLSRYPITAVKNWVKEPLGGTHPEMFGNEKNRWAGQPIVFHRSPLRVTIEVDQSGFAVLPHPLPGESVYKLTLFIIHYKSGGPGNYWRVKEAVKTMELVKAFENDHKDANVIVLGDFNAQATEPPLKILFEGGLIDAFAGKSPKDPVNITHASGRVIDRLLFNRGAHNELKAESRFVLGTINRPEGVDYRTTPNPPGWASDHYPVVVDLWPIEQAPPDAPQTTPRPAPQRPPQPK